MIGTKIMKNISHYNRITRVSNRKRTFFQTVVFVSLQQRRRLRKCKERENVTLTKHEYQDLRTRVHFCVRAHTNQLTMTS